MVYFKQWRNSCWEKCIKPNRISKHLTVILGAVKARSAGPRLYWMLFQCEDNIIQLEYSGLIVQDERIKEIYNDSDNN